MFKACWLGPTEILDSEKSILLVDPLIALQNSGLLFVVLAAYSSENITPCGSPDENLAVLRDMLIQGAALFFNSYCRVINCCADSDWLLCASCAASLSSRSKSLPD